MSDEIITPVTEEVTSTAAGTEQEDIILVTKPDAEVAPENQEAAMAAAEASATEVAA
jgi:hypothetical protein